jgi:hypothetical protein
MPLTGSQTTRAAEDKRHDRGLEEAADLTAGFPLSQCDRNADSSKNYSDDARPSSDLRPPKHIFCGCIITPGKLSTSLQSLWVIIRPSQFRKFGISELASLFFHFLRSAS